MLCRSYSGIEASIKCTKSSLCGNNGACQHVLCRAQQPQHADAHAPLHPTDQCLFKENRKPRPCRRAAYDVLQFRPNPQYASRFSCNGSWRCRPSLGYYRHCDSSRASRSKTRQAYPLQKGQIMAKFRVETESHPITGMVEVEIYYPLNPDTLLEHRAFNLQHSHCA